MTDRPSRQGTIVWKFLQAGRQQLSMCLSARGFIEKKETEELTRQQYFYFVTTKELKRE